MPKAQAKPVTDRWDAKSVSMLAFAGAACVPVARAKAKVKAKERCM